MRFRALLTALCLTFPLLVFASGEKTIPPLCILEEVEEELPSTHVPAKAPTVTQDAESVPARNSPLFRAPENISHVTEILPANIHEVSATSSEPSSGADIAKIRQQIETKWGAASSAPETVLYPMAGSDAATVLGLFPGAKNYVLINENPLIPEGRDGQNVEYTRSLNPSTWTHSEIERSEKFRLEKTLGSIQGAFPEAKILKIKGSVDQFHPRGLERDLIPNLALGGDIVSWLRATGGLLVEGTSLYYPPSGEFSGGRQLAHSAQGPQSTRANPL